MWESACCMSFFYKWAMKCHKMRKEWFIIKLGRKLTKAGNKTWIVLNNVLYFRHFYCQCCQNLWLVLINFISLSCQFRWNFWIWPETSQASIQAKPTSKESLQIDIKTIQHFYSLLRKISRFLCVCAKLIPTEDEVEKTNTTIITLFIRSQWINAEQIEISIEIYSK